MSDSALQSAATLAELSEVVRKHGDTEIFTFDHPQKGAASPDIPVAIVPEGRRVMSLRPILEDFLQRPSRRRGTDTVYDPKSFVALVNRFGSTAEALIFADPDEKAPRMVCVFNHHPEGPENPDGSKNGWRDHRAVYTIRLSERWEAWAKADGQWMDQVTFAEFIEDRIQDVVLVDTDQEPKLNELLQLLGGKTASASKLMELARGIEISAGVSVKTAITLATGECNVQFVEQHNDGRGAPLTVPNLFFIGIPVFDGGAPYRIAVRLRYRLRQGVMHWSVVQHRPDQIFDDAFDGLKQQVERETSVTVVSGKPE